MKLIVAIAQIRNEMKALTCSLESEVNNGVYYEIYCKENKPHG